MYSERGKAQKMKWHLSTYYMLYVVYDIKNWLKHFKHLIQDFFIILILNKSREKTKSMC